MPNAAHTNAPEGLITLYIGSVTQGQNGKIQIDTSKAEEILKDIQRVVQSINAEIENRVPILGDSESPYPLTEVTEVTLNDLGHVLATRTREQLQLQQVVLPDVFDQSSE